jgi:Arc/MetJ-type ribon-helix-helix transcriptional regulator
MNMSLKPEMQRIIDERLRSGQFESAEQVLEAGLIVLRQQDDSGDFDRGELDRLLEEGERSVEKDGVIAQAMLRVSPAATAGAAGGDAGVWRMARASFRARRWCRLSRTRGRDCLRSCKAEGMSWASPS